MPKIDFSFQGWVRGAEVTEATDVEGKPVDTSKLTADELVDKLQAGELFISLGDYLYESRKNEIEMFDFTRTED